jgi:hypothetical protein
VDVLFIKSLDGKVLVRYLGCDNTVIAGKYVERMIAKWSFGGY